MSEVIKSEVMVEKSTDDNIYGVEKAQWRKWSSEGREMFNHLYGTVSNNKGIYCSTDLFGTSEQVEKVLNSTIWNMAWEAATRVTKKYKSK